MSLTKEQVEAFDKWFTSIGHVPGVKEAFDAGWAARATAEPTAPPPVDNDHVAEGCEKFGTGT